ncbi:hypothetical protein PcPA57_01980 [Pasteurella canis]|uniref:Transposase n=1 Tax=Pasteurella canis TaxID=753 RepID=A0ABQ4VGL6_9PAST|nr:hypothetical protein PA42_13290 [Pasteurella canis]GJJ79478.1 hypothetical protein PcPA57_01980 [Pasteurella canis]
MDSNRRINEMHRFLNKKEKIEPRYNNRRNRFTKITVRAYVFLLIANTMIKIFPTCNKKRT